MMFHCARKAEQQLIENQQRLDRMAHHDQLTGLPNRHYLTAFLPQAIEEAKAANTMLGVVFLDLDRFKHINDTRGHETGDKLLQEVAAQAARPACAIAMSSSAWAAMNSSWYFATSRTTTRSRWVPAGSSRH